MRSGASNRRIGVVTGGGDCPGLNAVIRSVVLGAINRGWEVWGIERGFEGLLAADGVKQLDRASVRGIIHTGGTILGTSNRGNPFRLRREEGGREVFVDVSGQVVEQFHALGLEALVVIGGDGTLTIANQLAGLGVPVVGVPKTIDNDLMATEVTFGFHTALVTATDAIDKIHATAESHERVMLVEVMGRYSGWIALYSGLAGGADVILLPEIPYNIEAVARKIGDRWRRRRNFAIVVVSEGAMPVGGDRVYKAREAGREPRLGGIAEQLAVELETTTGRETRSLVLGHLQRGGQPTPTDRILATRFGAAAVRAIERGERNVMVAIQSNRIVSVPLLEAIVNRKQVPLDSDVILTAREMGVCFGDEVHQQ
ncbi:MAG: 6-phosphofructokinase [Acidobacteria bacterium]|nr:6-phosphofructokinase [Acidobacteriota bacterium]